jgi:hypothetical protein
MRMFRKRYYFSDSYMQFANWSIGAAGGRRGMCPVAVTCGRYGTFSFVSAGVRGSSRTVFMGMIGGIRLLTNTASIGGRRSKK